VHIEWDVPRTIFWYTSGQHYLGTLVVRHERTEELNQASGHVGYQVVAPWCWQRCCSPAGKAVCALLIYLGAHAVGNRALHRLSERPPFGHRSR
jgi:hypothetical protein